MPKHINHDARTLQLALARWHIADDQLAAAARDFIAGIIHGHTGTGTYDALESLRNHLAQSRYRVPAEIADTVRELTHLPGHRRETSG